MRFLYFSRPLGKTTTMVTYDPDSDYWPNPGYYKRWFAGAWNVLPDYIDHPEGPIMPSFLCIGDTICKNRDYVRTRTDDDTFGERPKKRPKIRDWNPVPSRLSLAVSIDDPDPFPSVSEFPMSDGWRSSDTDSDSETDIPACRAGQTELEQQHDFGNRDNYNQSHEDTQINELNTNHYDITKMDEMTIDTNITTAVTDAITTNITTEDTTVSIAHRMTATPSTMDTAMPALQDWADDDLPCGPAPYVYGSVLEMHRNRLALSEAARSHLEIADDFGRIFGVMDGGWPF